MKNQKDFLDFFQIFSFIAFSIIAIYLTEEVIHQFASNDTSLKQTQVPIKEYPTMTICFGKDTNFEYGTDFKISYRNVELQLGAENEYEAFENEYEYNDYYSGTVYDYDYDLSDKMKVSFQKVFCYYENTTCYRITHKVENAIKWHIVNIFITFNEEIKSQDLPNVELYLTSESNANGIISKDWLDGNELQFDFEKVIVFVDTIMLQIKHEMFFI